MPFDFNNISSHTKSAATILRNPIWFGIIVAAVIVVMVASVAHQAVTFRFIVYMATFISAATLLHDWSIRENLTDHSDAQRLNAMMTQPVVGSGVQPRERPVLLQPLEELFV